MGGKAYRQDTRINKIFKGPVEAKKVYFKNTEVFSSSHDVAYHADIHNIIMKEIEDETDVISQAPVVTKEGWSFVGWRLDTEPDPDVLVEYIATEDDIHVYAVFEKDVNLSLIGGEEELHQSGIRYYNNGNYRNPLITLASAVLDEWSLVGYRLDTQPDATVPYYGGQSYTFAQDATLYTVFKQTVTLKVLTKGTTYTYPRTRYVNNGNYNNPSVTVSDPTLDDAVFDGYSDDASSTDIAVATLSNGYTFEQDTNLYAVWTYNDAVLSSTTTYSGRKSEGSVTVLTGINGHHYKSLTVSVQAFIAIAGWAIQTHANAYLGGVFLLHITMHDDQQFEDGPCADRRTASVSVPVDDQENWSLTGSFSGDIFPWGDDSWIKTFSITGIGRTIVY